MRDCARRLIILPVLAGALSCGRYTSPETLERDARLMGGISDAEIGGSLGYGAGYACARAMLECATAAGAPASGESVRRLNHLLLDCAAVVGEGEDARAHVEALRALFEDCGTGCDALSVRQAAQLAMRAGRLTGNEAERTVAWVLLSAMADGTHDAWEDYHGGRFETP